MFESLPSQNRRCGWAIAASLALHLAAGAFLVQVVRPLWLQQTARGGGRLSKLDISKAVNLGQKPADKKQASVARKSLLTYDSRVHQRTHEVSSPEVAEGLGPILKSYPLLVPSIHDIQIALPVTAPDPEIRRSDLPQGFEGDAVVQITIDKTGKVVRTKVVQALGYDGLDLRITSTLMTWKFTPACFDGVPVASLQEIHLHYPDDAVSG
jgi:TonB family protein